MNKQSYITLDTLINLLSVKLLADLCGISRVYCYKLLKTNTKVEIFKKYCIVQG